MSEPSNNNSTGYLPIDWKSITIQLIGEVITGRTPKSSNPDYYTEEGFLWASPADLGKGKYIDFTKKQLTDLGFEQTRKLPPKSVMVTCIGSTIGKIGMTNSWMATNQQINSIVCNAENWSEFYYYVMEYMASDIKSLAGTQAVPLLNKTDFSAINVVNPPLLEQQKIAEILSTVDAKIKVIDQQISETQELKKGLMQRLLTKGIGHTEFKDSPLGKIPKSWEVKKFNEVCFNSSIKYSKPNGKCIELEHIEQQTSRLIDYGEIADKSSVKNAFSVGDVLFCKLRPYLRKYWKCEFEGGCTSELMVLSPKDNFTTDYLFYIVQQDSFIENSVSKSYGTKMPRTSWKILSEFELGLPPKDEQLKIGEILNASDEKLEILSNKKTQFQELKKGLMQQLLTGKVRVKVTAGI